MNKQPVNVAVVIAAYNEALNIRPLTQRLIRVLNKTPSIRSWRLIYVVDGADGTAEIVRSFAAQQKEVTLDYRVSPAGLGKAFRRGFDLVPADTDFVVTMDADLNHQPEEIPRLLTAAMQKQADIVIGSRRTAESSIQGAPLWKLVVSRAVNRLMQLLTGASVMDMTSGFRVYRTEFVRALRYQNDGFAFLPEILIGAISHGKKIIEEPIQFIFRKAGESKLSIPATSLSYIRLFARHSSGSALAVLLLLTVGVLIRIWFCCREHRFPGDSDSILAGLCALDVLDGKLPLFFPGGIRLGPFSCYATAGMFAAFGPSRMALGATSVLFGALFLVFLYLALSEVGGRRAALFAMPLVIMPPLEFWQATYPTWGYIEIMACSAAILWLGLRLLLRPSGPVRLELMYGFVLGLGLWSSVQSVMISGPMTLVLLLRARRSWRFVGLAAIGAILGGLPYISVFLRDGIAAFFKSYATRPVTDAQQILSNLVFFSTENVPTLLFSHAGAGLFSSVRTTAQLCVVITMLVLALATVIVPRWRPRAGSSKVNFVTWLLPLILLFSAALFSISSAGSFRGWTVRYVIPVYLIIPFSFLLLFVRANSRWLRVATASGAVTLAILNCLNYPFFNGVRKQQEAQLSAQRATLEWIRSKGRNAVLGDYFAVYALNFDSQREVRAVPIHESQDYFRFGHILRDQDARIALLDLDAQHLRKWLKNANLTGSVERLNPSLYGVAVDEPVESSMLYDVGRAAFDFKANFSTAQPEELAGFKLLKDKSQCYIDLINDIPVGSVGSVSHQKSLSLVGWVADTKHAVAPSRVYFNLRSENTSLYALAQTLFDRPDVAKGAHQRGLLRTGFILTARPIPPDTYRLFVLQANEGAIRQCETVFQLVVR